MKVFVAGASGALGRQLVPKLVAAGHQVVGMTRSGSKLELLRGLGAEPVLADALDPDAVGQAVSESRPEVIVHQLTAIPSSPNLRKIDRDFELTNRLRNEGTDNLLAAARAAGARRFVAQSFAPYVARTGGPVQDERAPIDPEAPAAARQTVATLRHLERTVAGQQELEGVILRYGVFYGPGTSLTTDPPGAQIEMIRKRMLPIVGAGTGTWSFIHIEDAASATAAAVEGGPPGTYHVADDEPAAVSEWLPFLAEELGAKPPRRIPRWLARLVAGELAVVMMTEARGASNAKAKRELGWQPRYASWREGFAEGLA